ncbi:34467_t:CDS:2, partial [Racocetra persica]
RNDTDEANEILSVSPTYVNLSDFIHESCITLNSENTRSGSTSDSEDPGIIVQTIALGASFPSWDSFETSLECYRKENGFKPIKERRDMDTKTGNIVHWCFECEFSGEYKPKHTADFSQARQTFSKKTQCSWRCNASFRKTEGKVYINKLVEKHNHNLIPHHEEFAPSLRQLPQDVLNEIKFMTQKCEYGARQQRHPASNINQDASLMIEYLISKQREDPNWKINIYFEGVDTSLAHLFWQTPSQSRLYEQFHNVIVNDNTCKTNIYRILLNIFVRVDSQNRTKMLAQALMISQQWFLNPICAPEQSITIQFTHNITSVQEIQNDELNSSFDIIEELRGPDCIGIAKKEVQTALDTGIMDEFIGILHNFIESNFSKENAAAEAAAVAKASTILCEAKDNRKFILE